MERAEGEKGRAEAGTAHNFAGEYHFSFCFVSFEPAQCNISGTTMDNHSALINGVGSFVVVGLSFALLVLVGKKVGDRIWGIDPYSFSFQRSMYKCGQILYRRLQLQNSTISPACGILYS